MNKARLIASGGAMAWYNLA